MAAKPRRNAQGARAGHSPLYRKLLHDGFLAGCISQRVLAVQGLNWGVDKGKAKSGVAKSVDAWMKKLPMNRIIEEAMNCRWFGYQPMEVMWDLQDGKWIPVDIVGKPPRWFVFNTDCQLMYRSREKWSGTVVPPNKFLLPRSEASFENPYGIGALSRVFWSIMGKRNGLAWLMKFSEKFGIPWAVGKLPRGLEQSEYDDLAKKLDQMVQDAIAVIPNDSSIDLLSTSGKGSSASGSSSVHTLLIDTCKKEISVTILGHEGAAQSTPGKIGGEDMAIQVVGSLTQADQCIIEDIMKTLIGWYVTVNFGDVECPVFSMWETGQVNQALATRDQTLMALGVRFDHDYIAETYSINGERFTMVEPPPAQGAEPGLPAPGSADAQLRRSPARSTRLARDAVAGDSAAQLTAALQGLPPEAMDALSTTLLDPVIKLVRNGGSLEQIGEGLAKAYPNMKDQEFQDTLMRILFVSETWGRLQAAKKD